MTDEQYNTIMNELRSIRAAQKAPSATSAASTAAVATDEELDGKYGNEPIRKDPSAKYWEGASHKDDLPSECPADYLDALAKYKDACAFMNEKSGDEAKAKYIAYDRRDAARYRGWAARVRAGKAGPKPARRPAAVVDSFELDSGDEEIPFISCSLSFGEPKDPTWIRW